MDERPRRVEGDARRWIRGARVSIERIMGVDFEGNTDNISLVQVDALLER